MLEVNHITKSFRKKTVLKDAAFCARPGDCIGLIGANGCGKSTLLQIASGMLAPDSGSVSWNNVPLSQGRKQKKALFGRYIGYVPQNNPLFEDMSVMDHLALWYSGSGKSLKQDLAEGFPARLGIADFADKKVSELSGGMKKRLSLACALVSDPPVVILDEPAAALDLVCQAEIRSYLKQLKEAGRIILLATHEEADFSFCSRLLLLHDGILTELSAETPASEIIRLIGQKGGMPNV